MKRTDLRQIFRPLMDDPDQEKIRLYIHKNLEHIKQELRNKITESSYWLDSFLEPPDTVVIASGTNHQELHPLFKTGHDALDKNNYEIAIENFTGLVEDPDIKKNVGPGDRSTDWLAYAFALNGQTNEAQNILEPLCAGNYEHPSAYWNLASIEHDPEKQLDILNKGMQQAPAMELLMKAVYIAICQQFYHNKLCEWLSQMPFFEGVLLRYYYAKQNDANQLQKMHKILTQYIINGDLEIPISSSKIKSKKIINNIKAICTSAKNYKQLEILDFWLRCMRPYEGQWRLRPYDLKKEYYTTCTDTHRKLDRPKESAESFHEEGKSYLDYLNSLKDAGRDIKVSGTFKNRLNNNLSYYKNSEAEEVGIRIFKYVVDWCRTNNIFIHYYDYHYYNSKVEAQPQTILTDKLVSISRALNVGFRGIHDFDSQKRQFDHLKEVLDNDQKQKSASKTEELIEVLQKLSKIRKNKAVSKTLQDCSVCFKKFMSSLEEELTDDEFYVIKGIRDTINRVINNYPKLYFSFNPVDNAKPTFLGDGNVTAFSLRLKTEGTISANEIPRLIKANAFIEQNGEKCHFPLHDNPQELPIVLQPNQSVLLTFEDEGKVKIDAEECTLEVGLIYELFGKNFSTINHSVPLKKARPSNYTHNREIKVEEIYIYGREIKVEEIEGHFFGRSDPTEKIMECIRGQKTAYIEGIRRSGKTSLINSIRHEIQKYEDKEPSENYPKLIPVHLDAKIVENYRTSGQMLHSFFFQILDTIQESDRQSIKTPRIRRFFPSLYRDRFDDVSWPTEENCGQNCNKAYTDFATQLKTCFPHHRIIIFLDDFQDAVKLASAPVGERKDVGEDILALLRLIQVNAIKNPHLTWLFAGFRSQEYFQRELPELKIWGQMERIQIDFLKKTSVGEILIKPLNNTDMAFTEEAVNRVFEYTQGYPEMVQKMASQMLRQAMNEKRYAILPADADQAAREIIENDTTIYDTWCPRMEISAEQQQFISNLIESLRYEARSGQTVKLTDLDSENQFNEKIINDLVTRKILKNSEDGTQRVGFKAPLLELWLKKNWAEQPPRQAIIFTDIENLTRGSGKANVNVSDQWVELGAVLDAIDSYARGFSDQSPLKFAAVFHNRKDVIKVLEEKGYNKGDDLTIMGENELKKYHSKSQRSYDDAILQQMIGKQIHKDLHDHPSITDVILVTGDIDFKIIGVDTPLEKGMYVHVLSYKDTMSAAYKNYAAQNDRMEVVYLEDLIAE